MLSLTYQPGTCPKGCVCDGSCICHRCPECPCDCACEHCLADGDPFVGGESVECLCPCPACIARDLAQLRAELGLR